MKPKHWIALVAGLAVIFAFHAFQIIALGPGDQMLIRAGMVRAIQASKDGQAGGVVDKLTEGFSMNGQHISLGKVADFIRNSKPDIVPQMTNAAIEGDSAHMICPVKVHAQYLGFSYDGTMKDVEFVFKKVPSSEWLIIPTHKWELDQVNVPPGAVQDALAGL